MLAPGPVCAPAHPNATGSPTAAGESRGIVDEPLEQISHRKKHQVFGSAWPAGTSRAISMGGSEPRQPCRYQSPLMAERPAALEPPWQAPSAASLGPGTPHGSPQPTG